MGSPPIEELLASARQIQDLLTEVLEVQHADLVIAPAHLHALRQSRDNIMSRPYKLKGKKS